MLAINLASVQRIEYILQRKQIDYEKVCRIIRNSYNGCILRKQKLNTGRFT